MSELTTPPLPASEETLLPPFQLTLEEMTRIALRRGRARYLQAIATYVVVIGTVMLMAQLPLEVTLLTLAAAGAIGYLTIPFAIRRSLGDHRNGVLRQTREIRYGPRGLRQSISGGIETFVPWSCFIGYRTSGEGVELDFAKDAYILVPHRVMSGDHAAEIEGHLKLAKVSGA